MHATQPPTEVHTGHPGASLLRPAERGTIEMTLTGSPAAVVTAARTISRLMPVTAMRHTPTANTTAGGSLRIRLTLTCQVTTRGRS